MVKAIKVRASLALDAEIVAQIKRIAADAEPGSFISGYSVDRPVGRLTQITVTFFTDDEFSPTPEQEKQQEG